MNNNYGHNVWKRPEIWAELPEYFIITDPDLELNKNLPDNFIDDLLFLSNHYKASRVGFSLDISDNENMYKGIYFGNVYTIYDWEKRFWVNKCPQINDLICYYSEIDTTFFLGCKSRFNNPHIRVAGNFTAKHLPWYPENNLMLGMKWLNEMYSIENTTSTTGKLILKNINKVFKYGEYFYVQLDDSHRDIFWTSIYKEWRNDAFNVFNRYVKIDTTVIDIGSWIGPMTLYCAKMGAKVIALDGDTQSCKTLINNVLLNDLKDKVNIINKAIYKNHQKIWFGENIYRNDGMNASTSKIVSENSNKYKYQIDTITFFELIDNINDISLVKVNIEGDEQYIINELLELCLIRKIPAYITFHFNSWGDAEKLNFKKIENLFSKFIIKDKNFENIIDVCNYILQNPSESLLFTY
jgi:FkbM family methyltransferase